MNEQILNDALGNKTPHWYEIAFSSDAYAYTTMVMERPQRWFVKANNPDEAMRKCMRSSWSKFGGADVAKVTQTDWALNCAVEPRAEKPVAPAAAEGGG